MSSPSPPGDTWRPTASWQTLRRRAALLACLRAFFAERDVLEVETPLLQAATVTDLHLESLSSRISGADGHRRLYLQTSPEFAMKRLLAAASGPIYQIAKAFRDDQPGRFHNPEFTILEWYRPGWNHYALLDEIDQLLVATLGSEPAERVTYGELFARHLGVDAHRDSAQRLQGAAREAGIDAVGLDDADRDTWLHLLLSHAVEPHLGRGRPTFVLDFPASQAALARLRAGDPPVAERFEVYVEGIELANGFHELKDAAEQRRRFDSDLAARRQRGLPEVPIDERLLAALEAGFPDCAGVALGVDRLVMLATGVESLAEVVAFPIDRA
jgi:lysyl-tRNA synthetase class 2